MLQAGRLLSYLQEKQFDLILHGHRHYPMSWIHNMIPYEAPIHGSWSEPVIISSGSLSADSDHLPSSVPNTYQLIGIRKKKDPLRPVCTVIRRKFSAVTRYTGQDSRRMVSPISVVIHFHQQRESGASQAFKSWPRFRGNIHRFIRNVLDAMKSRQAGCWSIAIGHQTHQTKSTISQCTSLRRSGRTRKRRTPARR